MRTRPPFLLTKEKIPDARPMDSQRASNGLGELKRLIENRKKNSQPGAEQAEHKATSILEI